MANRRVPRLVVGVAMLPPAFALLLLAIVRPSDAPWMLAVPVAALAIVGYRAAGRAKPREAGWLLALSTFAILALWPETALRALGYRFDPAGTIQFGYPRPELMVQLDSDPELFWKLPSTMDGVNSHGFLDTEFEIPKPDGVWRAVFLGDSCTQQGWPGGVAAYIRAKVGDVPRIDAVNLGVSGYTSYQGTVVANRWVDALAPDLGVVFFGWNDHWRAYGQPDVDKAQSWLGPGGPSHALISASRTAQWIVARSIPRDAAPIAESRVPIADYRTNLIAIGERFESAGSHVMLLTAPTSFETLGVPDRTVALGYAESGDQARTMHRDYNRVVREVAAARGWALVDLEARAEALDDPRRVFLDDGIHFTEHGLRWVARIVADRITRDGLPPADS